MENHPRISELLAKTKAFDDLEQPIILNSGQLGIYYINTQYLTQDPDIDNFLKEKGESSQAIVQHSIELMNRTPEFREVIDIITEKAKTLLSLPGPQFAISGGQRRDWIFSGPVAHQLGLPHLSLYKNGVIEAIGPEGDRYAPTSFFATRDAETLHIADLLTEASSCYRIENRIEQGWIPMLRRAGVKVNNLIAVVTRCQGGENILSKQFVNTYTFVAINESFLKQHARYPERDIEYSKTLESPVIWSRNYLKENGAIALIDFFNPEKGKLDKAKRFIERYKDILIESGRWDELDYAVQDKFGKSLQELVA